MNPLQLIGVIIIATLITDLTREGIKALAKAYIDYRFHRRVRSRKWEICGGRWVKRTDVQR